MSAPHRTRRRVVGQLATLPLLALARGSRAAARERGGGTREIDISGYNTALLPREHGQLTPLTAPLRRRYPSRDHCMQMAGFFSDKRGLLVIAKDAHGGVADWEIRPGATLRIRFHGEVPEVESLQIAPTVEAAAAAYRLWASRQPWVMARRRTAPRLNFFSVASQSTQAAERAHLERVLANTKPPIAVWFTQWRRYPFDQKYPDYGAREPQEFARTLALCALRGAIALPYVNGLLWDQTLADFRETGVRIALRTEAQETLPYNAELNNLRFACPYTAPWQERIAAARASLLDAEGHRSQGIYLDMLAAAPPAICWADDHGHRPGDPYAWAQGVRALLQQIDGVIMIEGNAEIYLDRVDYLLMHLYTDRPDAVPLWKLVYGDQAYTVGWRLPPGATAAQLCDAVRRAHSFGVAAGATPWMTSDPESVLFERGAAQAALAEARPLQ
jgi:Domain of unknown function (DUF6259)